MRMLFFVGAALLLSVLAWATTQQLGIDLSRVDAAHNAVEFTDRFDLPLGTILGSDQSHTLTVPLSAVSPAFIQAILATEDARFYRHGAADPKALVRAARQWIVYGGAQSGGSTIDMQLARMLVPSPSTLRGKAEQIWNAQRLEWRNSKPQILEGYLNRLPMGGNIYGVAAAARVYFDESAADLDLAQSSLLAAIPNDPRRLDPYRHWSALKSRQHVVLKRMVAVGSITQSQAILAEAQQLHLRKRGDGIDDGAHLLFYLYPQLPPQATLVRTSIDRGLQRFVQTQVQAVVGALVARRVSDAAAIVIDNRTGEVLAYVGSPDYFSDAALGRNDGVQALRQPGSTLKPFLYELALERDTIHTDSILLDSPASYAISGGKLYSPADYTRQFSGPVLVRYALANSLNVPAVRVLSSLGVPNFLDRLHQLGFAHLSRRPAFYGLGLTLGSGEVSLWELAHAYLTIARGGSAIPLSLMPTRFAAPTPIGSPQMWSWITNVLADPYARAKSFGTHSILSLPFDSAVKTGTSSDFRDTWTVGFTRDYTVATWAGNFNGDPMRGVSGVSGAGPLWNRIMLHLHETREPAPFDPPAGFIATLICANSAKPPQPSCPAVVREYLLPRDLARLRNPHTRIGGSRDAIIFPRDGDRFVLNSTSDPTLAAMQRIHLQTAAGTPARWTANGVALAQDANGQTFWPLHLGRWRLETHAGAVRTSVGIIVIAPPLPRRPGFTITR
ncbi:MAG: penicillin-binding protein 1C [Candidatus Eremiobacteraeota bacterium]|nr:penicillin-binding protein 1C [Candidatus Eremiobacteraeota bacterium]